MCRRHQRPVPTAVQTTVQPVDVTVSARNPPVLRWHFRVAGRAWGSTPYRIRSAPGHYVATTAAPPNWRSRRHHFPGHDAGRRGPLLAHRGRVVRAAVLLTDARDTPRTSSQRVTAGGGTSPHPRRHGHLAGRLRASGRLHWRHLSGGGLLRPSVSATVPPSVDLRY